MPRALAHSSDQLELGAGDLLVMAASGGDQRAAQRLLSARDVAVAVVNAARVRAFARARGRLAETDRSLPR